MDREAITWAAGLYEGEGSCRPKVNKGYSCPELKIKMTDLEPLEKFKSAVLDIGHIYGPYPGEKPGNKPYWRYEAHGYENVQAILAMIYPWLLPRRRKQAEATLIRGRSNFHKRLTLTQAREIRRLAKTKTHREVAKMFNTTRSNVTQIVNKKSWHEPERKIN